MAWSLARSLKAAFDERNRRHPAASRSSDGTIGDRAHRLRVSDHNPCDDHNIVHAGDFTHDPGHGFDAHAWVRRLAAHGDQRVKYLISRGQIWNPATSAWGTYRRLRAEGHSRLAAARMSLPGWRAYTGSNPHNLHAHVSIKHTAAARDDTSTWFYNDSGIPTPTPTPTPPQEDDDMACRYEINGQIWTTDFVWRQHWESPGPGLSLVLAHTRDLGKVPQDFHDSLVDITETQNKARDAVNYGVANQEALGVLAGKVDAIAAKVGA